MTKVITFGEVMQRLSPPGFQRVNQATSFEVVYGGGEANVAVSLARFGVSSAHVTAFPDNDLGHAAADYLRSSGLNMDHVIYGGKRLGIYFLEKGASIRASKVIYDRANSSFAELNHELLDWNKILTGASWFHWTGITPAISEQACLACIEAVHTAKKLGITVSGDITYRKNLWQYGRTVQEVIPLLVDHSDVVMCGESEAKEIFGINVDGFEDRGFSLVASGLKTLFPNLKKVISTKRETIHASYNTLSGMLWTGEDLLESSTFHINPIIDRIGGGDAFFAGYIYGTIQKWEDQQVINFATAASVWKHTVPGDANMATVQEIIQVLKGESVGRLIR